jgi:hypothetical protein
MLVIPTAEGNPGTVTSHVVIGLRVRLRFTSELSGLLFEIIRRQSLASLAVSYAVTVTVESVITTQPETPIRLGLVT